MNGVPDKEVKAGFENFEKSDGSVSGMAKGLFKDVMTSNPYFAAGGGLMVLGSAIALGRSSVIKLSQFAYRQMIVDLEIPSKDKSYYWFLEWMSQHKQRNSRHLSVETNYTQHDNGTVSTKFSLVPGPGRHIIKYRGAYMLVNRERSGKLLDMTSGTPFETVTITTLYRDKKMFAELLDEAKQLALKSQQGKTVIYTSWGQDWRPFGQPRRKRLVQSVILDEGVAEGILRDVRDFLSSGNWYHERGIPYRRGYLLFGPPGSGKTSFIQALAGELDYNICILNLSEANLTDDRLTYLMNHIPQRSILLLEDIDAAFNKREQTKEKGYSSGVTFSGLLNALDGVASAEEMITFMTTNHPEKLDPAIMRPGRVDYKALIDNASDYQVRHMFCKFYGDDEKKCEEFLQAYRTANAGPVSTAMLQGLFVYNKNDPEGAISTVKNMAKSN